MSRLTITSSDMVNDRDRGHSPEWTQRQKVKVHMQRRASICIGCFLFMALKSQMTIRRLKTSSSELSHQIVFISFFYC